MLSPTNGLRPEQRVPGGGLNEPFCADCALLNWRTEFLPCGGPRPLLRVESHVARFGPTTPTRARRPSDASVDPTEARSVAGFGPDDRGPPRVNRTLHSVSSPGRPNATLRRGDGDQRHRPRWPRRQGLPDMGRGKPLPSPSRVPLQHRARSAHRANGSSGNTGSSRMTASASLRSRRTSSSCQIAAGS